MQEAVVQAVLKGKNFPFISQKTTHRPEKKFRPKVFQFPLYAAPVPSKIITLVILVFLP